MSSLECTFNVQHFTRIQRADDLYRREKDVHEAALSSHTAEATELEERLLTCRDTSVEEARVAAASRRVADSRTRRSQLKAEHARERKELMDSIMEAVTKCADHRSVLYFVRVLESFMTGIMFQRGH